MTIDPDPAPAPSGRPRRRWRWAAVAAVILALPFAVLGGLWLRLEVGALTLPAAVSERVEARIDTAMAANRVNIGQIEMQRPGRGEGGLDMILRDVRLTDPDGGVRAALPVLVVGLSAEALMRGRFHPRRVDLAGAGLRLARDAEGQIDLALIAGTQASEISLAETLARLDAMLAAPQFGALEEIVGSGLELTMADAMTGQVMRVRDARMRLERSRDGVLSLSLGGALEGSRDATLDIVVTRDDRSGTTDLGLGFEGLAARDVATISPALAWIDLMRAPISGFMASEVKEDGSLGDLRMTLDIGAGHLDIGATDAPLRFEAVTAALRYEAQSRRITFDRFNLIAPDLGFAATGHADVAPGGARYTAQFRMSAISVMPGDLYAAPLALDGAALDFRLTLDPALEIEIGQALIHDADMELSARGHIAARGEGLDIALDATLPAAGARDLLDYWPEAAVPRTRRWLDENLLAARLEGVEFALRRGPDGETRHALTLDFSETRLQAMRSLPPIEGGAGSLSIAGPRLVLRLDAGQVPVPDGAAVALDGSAMTIGDLGVRGPQARIDLAVAGEVTDVLRLLEEPPVRLFRDGAMTAERVGRGGAALTARIDTRLMRQEGIGDTTFRAEGEVLGLVSDTLVPGRRLEADALQVSADNAGVTVSGQGRFDDVPFTGRWQRPLGPDAPRAATVAARAPMTRERLAVLGVALPPWLMAGETEMAVTVDLVDGAAPVVSASSDLAGAALSVPQLGWGLAAASTGALSAEIRLGPDPALSRIAVDAGGLSMQGRAGLGAGGALERLTIDRLRVGGWLDVTGALIARGGGRPPAVEIGGGTVDLTGAPQGGGGDAGGPGGGPITATLDRLQVSEGIALTALVAEMNTGGGGLSGQFRARVNGEAPITGTLVATEAGPAVRIRAEDGGAVLRAAGVFRSAHGGQMELVLAATGARGSYDGTLSIDSPRLRDAPAMAELLNVVSVIGLLEQLAEEGINLGDVDARFRLTPTQVILTEGAAVGASLGVSMDGIYQLQSRQLDMAGVISPLNAVNGLIGAIFTPRREGLFGFAYRLTGPSENPQVSVNPLSILTPGVFREIFRRPPPELPETQ